MMLATLNFLGQTLVLWCHKKEYVLALTFKWFRNRENANVTKYLQITYLRVGHREDHHTILPTLFQVQNFSKRKEEKYSMGWIKQQLSYSLQNN